MKQFIIAASMGAALWSGAAVAADIKVLSAGAVKPGLLRAADDFKRASGNEVTVQFNTAPELARKLAEGEAADILIAPPALLDAICRPMLQAGKTVMVLSAGGLLASSDLARSQELVNCDVPTGLNWKEHSRGSATTTTGAAFCAATKSGFAYRASAPKSGK